MTEQTIRSSQPDGHNTGVVLLDLISDLYNNFVEQEIELETKAMAISCSCSHCSKTVKIFMKLL